MVQTTGYLIVVLAAIVTFLVMSSLLYVRFRSNGIAPFLREAGVEDLGPAAFFPTGRTRIQSGWEETEYIIAQRPPLFTEVEVPAKPDTDESETMDDDRGVGSNPSRWQPLGANLLPSDRLHSPQVSLTVFIRPPQPPPLISTPSNPPSNNLYPRPTLPIPSALATAAMSLKPEPEPPEVALGTLTLPVSPRTMSQLRVVAKHPAWGKPRRVWVPTTSQIGGGLASYHYQPGYMMSGWTRPY